MHHRPRLKLRGCCTATWHRLALPSRYHRRHAAVCGPTCLHLLEGDAVFLPIVSGFGEDTAYSSTLSVALAALSCLWAQRCVPPAASSGTPASRIGPEEAPGGCRPREVPGQVAPACSKQPRAAPAPTDLRTCGQNGLCRRGGAVLCPWCGAWGRESSAPRVPTTSPIAVLAGPDGAQPRAARRLLI